MKKIAVLLILFPLMSLGNEGTTLVEKE